MLVMCCWGQGSVATSACCCVQYDLAVLATQGCSTCVECVLLLGWLLNAVPWAARLQYLQHLNASKLGTVPLQFMEYGTLTNAYTRVSAEPGAFGGAWTVASSIQAAANGVSRVFHWKLFDNVDTPVNSTPNSTQRRLYYSNAFVAAAARKVFADADHAQILQTESAETLAKPTGSTMRSPGNLSASAMGAWSQDATIFSLMASVFATHKNASAQTVSKFRFSCGTVAERTGRAAADACEGSYGATGLYLTRERSPYDVILQEAQQNNWTRFNDGEVYSLGGMLNSAGQAALPQRAARYLGLQRDLFTPSQLPTDVVHVECSAGNCELSLTATPPTVIAVRIDVTRRTQ
eukprot:m.485891 g.485891  ORF g.485891 m.485891 type:complete len:349 (+) comp21739_c0_seq3:1824-2870(+)